MCHQLATAIDEDPHLSMIVDHILASDTVLLQVDRYFTDMDALHERIRRLADDITVTSDHRQSRRITIPVVYGGTFGPDLTAIADELGTSQQEIVRIHAETAWRVRLLGGPASGPLMDHGAFAQPVKRAAQPRSTTPPGSVAGS